MCAPLLILFGAHTTADMQIIPKFALFFSGWWIEIAGVGIYWALLGQGKQLSCDFVPSQFTWRVEAGVRVRLGFYNIQLYFQYFQCSSPHHPLVPSYPQNHTCGMLAHFSCLWLLCNKSQFSVWMREIHISEMHEKGKYWISHAGSVWTLSSNLSVFRGFGFREDFCSRMYFHFFYLCFS